MIKEVLLLFKTHLDIGFTDYSQNVVNDYINSFIPKAIKLGYELKNTSTPFIWTVGSWMIYQALEKDNGILEKAINDGIITWHGLPFTTHSELMNEKLFNYGLDISKKLDERFNKKTIAAKFSDVPGHTIGIVPLLAKSSIKLLHIGVNPATPVPNVPDIFRWNCDGESVIVMYNGGGYGDFFEIGDFAVGFGHTGDNLGPQNPDEIITFYEEVQRKYPNAKVRAATLNDVAVKLQDFDFPIVENEIGDTWIYGAGTDPKKMSGYRALLRQVDKEIPQSLLLVPEHTWGMDIKTHFPDTTDYMHNKKESIEKNNVEKSWEEQRNYVKDAANEMNFDLENETCVEKPDLTGFEEIFDYQTNIEISWQLFDNSDYERYMKKYVQLTVEWAIRDFTKVDLPKYQGGIFIANVVKAWQKENKKIYLLRFSDEDKYELPYLYLEEDNFNYTIKWFNKQSSRLPQAFWLKFKNYDENWLLDKMGQWIKPESIIGSPLISAVLSGVKNNTTLIQTLDAPLVAPFGRHLLDFDVDIKKQDLYFNLYNNVWNTNFPMWYSDDAKFRFLISEENIAT